MGLRNLTDSKRAATDERVLEELGEQEHELPEIGESDLLPRVTPTAPAARQSWETHDDAIATTPKDVDAPDPLSESSAEFSASLEALLLTIDGSEHDFSQSDLDVSVEEPTVADPSNAKGVAKNSTPGVDEIQARKPATPTTEMRLDSSLESMPLPTADPSPTPLPDVHPEPKSRKTKPEKSSKPATESEAHSETPLRSVIQGLRDSLLDAEVDQEPEAPRPISDGMPKSISEALPKFESNPRMRICGRCGHETRLRFEECRKCNHVDPSLGILDAVIAGDLAKVDRILLARPHLIGTRTSTHDWTLLHMAASGGNPKMVELLISRGASVNANTKDGKMPLHYAAGKGHLTIVQCLVQNHADLRATYRGKTPAEVARAHKQEVVADYLHEIQLR